METIRHLWYIYHSMNGKKKTENCLVCGSALEYLHHAENLVCVYCGATEQGHVKCPDGHFMCEGCHRGDAMHMIEGAVLTTERQDPVAIAELMMAHPNLPMLGCEHAYIAAGALMAALRNSPYGRGKITDADIREVFDRTARQAVSGYCGLTGVCGIAPAIGACFSVFLGSRCGSDTEQKITMDAVIKVSQAVAELYGAKLLQGVCAYSPFGGGCALRRKVRHRASCGENITRLQRQRQTPARVPGRALPLLPETSH